MGSRSKKCKFVDECGVRCSTWPGFNTSTEVVGKFCNQHKLEGMVDVVKRETKKCKFISEDGVRCSTVPSFNIPTADVTKFCKQHRLEGMINIRRRNYKKKTRGNNGVSRKSGKSRSNPPDHVIDNMQFIKKEVSDVSER